MFTVGGHMTDLSPQFTFVFIPILSNFWINNHVWLVSIKRPVLLQMVNKSGRHSGGFGKVKKPFILLGKI